MVQTIENVHYVIGTIRVWIGPLTEYKQRVTDTDAALNHEPLTRKVSGKKTFISFRFYRFALIQFTEITGDFYLHLRESRNKRWSFSDTTLLRAF